MVYLKYTWTVGIWAFYGSRSLIRELMPKMDSNEIIKLHVKEIFIALRIFTYLQIARNFCERCNRLLFAHEIVTANLTLTRK